jgi:hypothetical protein
MVTDVGRPTACKATGRERKPDPSIHGRQLRSIKGVVILNLKLNEATGLYSGDRLRHCIKCGWVGYVHHERLNDKSLEWAGMDPQTVRQELTERETESVAA